MVWVAIIQYINLMVEVGEVTGSVSHFFFQKRERVLVQMRRPFCLILRGFPRARALNGQFTYVSKFHFTTHPALFFPLILSFDVLCYIFLQTVGRADRTIVNVFPDLHIFLHHLQHHKQHDVNFPSFAPSPRREICSYCFPMQKYYVLANNVYFFHVAVEGGGLSSMVKCWFLSGCFCRSGSKYETNLIFPEKTHDYGDDWGPSLPRTRRPIWLEKFNAASSSFINFLFIAHVWNFWFLSKGKTSFRTDIYFYKITSSNGMPFLSFSFDFPLFLHNGFNGSPLEEVKIKIYFLVIYYYITGKLLGDNKFSKNIPSSLI